MRTVLLSIVLAVTACASGPRHPTFVNVAAVRAEINGTIQGSSADRSVTSMGKTSNERAVVFTTTKAGVKQEETWTKASGAWKLENTTAISSAQ